MKDLKYLRHWLRNVFDEALNSKELSEEQATMYRSASMRLAYLSQDRPDLLVLGKELAKGLKKPNSSSFSSAEERSSVFEVSSKISTSICQSRHVYSVGSLGRRRSYWLHSIKKEYYRHSTLTWREYKQDYLHVSSSYSS